MLYDVAVIGGGPSGYAAAMRSVDLGKKTILFEKNKIGGAGVFDGALSSKTLWELSTKYLSLQDKNTGFSVGYAELDFNGVWAQMKAATMEKNTQLVAQIKDLESSGLLTCVYGHAMLASNTEIIANEISYEADKIILATGSRPRILPHIEVDEQHILTSDGLSNLKEFPKSLVVLGAGVIGCEFATIFSNFGKTDVFLIDKQERILPFEDDDISNAVASNFEQRGVTIHHGCGLQRMEIKDGMVEYEIINKSGKSEIYTVEKALISVGRVPNIENLGIENTTVKLSERGHIIDESCATSQENIFAVGDLTADVALVNVAELEGRHAIERAYGLNPAPLTYNNISSIMFLNPEVASVGMNEKYAREHNIPYKLAAINYNCVNRAIAMRCHSGFFKLMVTDDDDMRILGMRVVGPHASSTIQAISLLIQLNLGIQSIVETVHAHPSMPEAIQECARMLMGTSIIKPETPWNTAKCYRVDSLGKREDLDRFKLLTS